MSGVALLVDPKLKRWRAIVNYRLETGTVADVEHELEELCELHDLVERGPHWDAIVDIRIVRLGGDPTMTVERAERE